MSKKSRMKVSSVFGAVCASIVLGCGKHHAQTEHEEPPRIADYPCACKEEHISSVVTYEVIATEDIGKRYEVQTHHYYPWTLEYEGRESRVEVAVGYPNQYLLEGEPTDTSITNESCFCGGPWEFTTNGYFSCKRIAIRTGMNCTGCGGAMWETNVFIYADSKERGAK